MSHPNLIRCRFFTLLTTTVTSTTLKRQFTFNAGWSGTGGLGGTVRGMGGSMSKYGAANEEGYFYEKQKEQIQKLRQELVETGKFHQKDEPEEKELEKELD